MMKYYTRSTASLKRKLRFKLPYSDVHSGRLSSKSLSTTTTTTRPITFPSMGFSGAGFLVCYHLGVIECLKQQQLSIQRICGVSGGALAAVAWVADVNPEHGMQATLRVSQASREAGVLDTLQPGFSMLDVAYQETLHLLKDVDEDELLQKRIDYGQFLRIGLVDRRVFPPLGDNPRALCHVQRFRDLQDIVAACILSSYIPGITGPALGSGATTSSIHGNAIQSASRRMVGMIQAGCVVNTATGKPLQLSSINDTQQTTREICWDGGLVDGFPRFDASTLIVSPLAADFAGNPSISPVVQYNISNNAQPVRTFPLRSNVNVHVTTDNLTRLRRAVLSSEDDVLEAYYREGYDHAKLFLQQHNLQKVYHHATASTATAMSSLPPSSSLE